MWLQIVVIDKLDYCASKRNLDSCKDAPNFKVGASGQAVAQSFGNLHLCAWHLGAIRRPPLRSNAQFIKADIQSADLISHVLQTEEIDTIMHFAAQVQATLEACSTADPPTG